MGLAAQINVTNLDFMLTMPRRSFEWLRFDSTNDCNLHCVYCHNRRSSDRMDLERLAEFLDNNVELVENFQIGCVMEPTLDKRLTEIMRLISQSRAKPTREFMLQTNGVLLHTHDHAAMVAAGLTQLSLSIDSAASETFKLLRGGANVEKIVRNMLNFREKCPHVEIQFITTVNTANIGELDALIAWGLQLQVRRFILREMFFDPRSRVVDHDAMRRLLLAEGEFTKMQAHIERQFAGQAYFFFSPANRLAEYSQAVRAESYPATSRTAPDSQKPGRAT